MTAPADAEPTDAQVLARVAPPSDGRWRVLAAMRPWTSGAWDDHEVAGLLDHLHHLGLVLPTVESARILTDRYPNGRGLAAAPPAESVRLVSAYVHDEATAGGGMLRAGLVDGSIAAAIARVSSRRP